MANSEKDFLGTVALINQTHSLTFVMPAAAARPRNPLNNQYMPAINATSFPSIVVQGVRSPTITLASFWKPSFATATLMNGLMLNRDSNGNTDLWAIGLYNATANTWRVYDGCRATQLDLSAAATGGPITFQVSFDAVQASGDGEDSSTTPGYQTPTSFTSVSKVTDAGQATPVSRVNFGGTADQVRSWRLSVVNGQMAQHFFGNGSGTAYANSIDSAATSGVFTLEQSPTYTTRPSTAGTLNIPGPTTGTGVSWNLLLNLDESTQDKGTGMATRVAAYSLIDTFGGTNPCACSSI